jgi:hypothetical protein
MPQYIRAFVPGGTFFFTVTLLERRRKLLTDFWSGAALGTFCWQGGHRLKKSRPEFSPRKNHANWLDR